MSISSVRNTDIALGAENNATSPKGTGTTPVRQAAADGLPGRPSAPPLELSSLQPRNSTLPGAPISPKRAERTAEGQAATRGPSGPVAGQGASPGLSPVADIVVRAAAIGSQLTLHASPVQVQGEIHAPVENAMQPLLELQSLCARLNAEQCAEVNEQLQTAIRASAHLPIDQKLLGEIVADVTRAPRKPLPEYLAAKTFKTLGQHKLQMKNDGEVEPSSRVYNSILPDLAGCTDDRGALCRTLLLEGASHLFEGPRQKQRRDNFKTVIFNLNVAESEDPFQWAAHLRLEALNLYEV